MTKFKNKIQSYNVKYEKKINCEKEINTLGFWYQREDLSKKKLHEKYGEVWLENYGIDNPNEVIDDEGLKILNDYDHEMLINNFDKIPMGLEKKIHLGWFQHFFSWDKIDTYSAEVQGGFRGNWLDVPFPYAKSIYVDGYQKFSTQLTDPTYNWYELFIIINDLMFQHGRLLDIGITSVQMKINEKDGTREIKVDWSS